MPVGFREVIRECDQGPAEALEIVRRKRLCRDEDDAGVVLPAHCKLDEDGRALFRGQQIGFVFQSFQLLPALTALENVMLPLELNGHDDAREQAEYFLDRVELSERSHHYPRQMSGGEQQRVAIARAFAARPAILFADEPTGNLDTRTGNHIIELLFELNREQGATLVLVTHDNNLADLCERRIRLEAGALVAE